MAKSRILTAGATLFFTLICWSLSSPINSHQDEKFHLASIWCADGFDEHCAYQGLSETGVKTVLLKTNLCTPANTEETDYKRLLVALADGKCKFEFTVNEPLEKMDNMPNFFYETSTQIAAWIQPGHTQSFYYKALNLFDTNDAEQSVIRFRLVNSLLFVLLLIAFLLVSEQSIKSSALLGLFATMIPHGMFLISGVLNSSWSYAGCSLSWAFLYVLLNQPPRLNWKTGLATLGWIVSSGIVLFSRYDAIIIWVLTNLTILALNIYTGTKHPKIFLSALFIVSSIITRVSWLSFPRIEALIQAPDTQSHGLKDLLINFGTAIKLLAATSFRILGSAPPGWGPLKASQIIFTTNLLFFAVVTTAAFRSINKAKLSFFLLNLIMLLGIFLVQLSVRPNWSTPFYLIRTSWTSDSFFPRYFIPYFPFLFGMLILGSKNFVEILTNIKFKSSLLTVLTFTQAVTLHNIGKPFRENPSWYWQNFPIGVQPVFVIGTISFAVFLYLLLVPSTNEKRINAL